MLSLRALRAPSLSHSLPLLVVMLGCEASSRTSASAPVANIEVSPTSLDLRVGDTQGLTARALDAAGNEIRGQRLTWSVRDPQTATVTQGGLVTAVAAGTTQVSASAGGVSSIVDVDVARRPTALVNITPSSASVRVGESSTLTATALDNAGRTVTGRAVAWRSDNTSVATVSSGGVVTGVGAGTASITATIDGVSDVASVTVQALPVASIDVTPSTSSLRLGEKTQLNVTLADASGAPLQNRVVTWTSSNSSVASVSSTGVVTGAGFGNATITATSEGKTDTARITVTLLGLGLVR